MGVDGCCTTISRHTCQDRGDSVAGVGLGFALVGYASEVEIEGFAMPLADLPSQPQEVPWPEKLW